MLAEDDRQMRLLLAQTLREQGYEVIEAHDGEEMLRMLDIDAIENGLVPAVDLVVADIRMPGATGLDVLASLRQIDWHTQVILISAFAGQEVHDEARRLGAVAVLAKPFSLDRFVELVRDIAPPRWD
ncbi:MAG: response regulator [Deltaproteobacteria bacterium]|nr:response regulator [Deltaproteobacteria bacterium]